MRPEEVLEPIMFPTQQEDEEYCTMRSFTKYYQDNQTEKMGRVCSIHGRGENANNFCQKE
jgi:hypothetical protein